MRKYPVCRIDRYPGEGKDYSCRHKLRIVGNRKLLKPQSGSMCLLKKLRLPLLT